MIALVQRVARAEVRVGGERVGAIGTGLLVFVCAEPTDDAALADRLVERLLRLRIFSDAAGKMNRSLVDVDGALLVVSQFTLAADVTGGHRPSFSGAAPALPCRRVTARARNLPGKSPLSNRSSIRARGARTSSPSSPIRQASIVRGCRRA